MGQVGRLALRDKVHGLHGFFGPLSPAGIVTSSWVSSASKVAPGTSAPSKMRQPSGSCQVVTGANASKRIKTEPWCALSPYLVSEEREKLPMQRPWPEDRLWKASWQMSLPLVLHPPRSFHLDSMSVLAQVPLLLQTPSPRVLVCWVSMSR